MTGAGSMSTYCLVSAVLYPSQFVEFLPYSDISSGLVIPCLGSFLLYLDLLD